MSTPSPAPDTRRLRPYGPEDRAACLAIFDGNVPRFFAAAERSDFAAFLDDLAVAWDYLVLDEAGTIVACGGIERDPARRQAGLCWGMVARDHQHQGLGTILTEARIAAARTMADIDTLVIDTSQHTAPFYARFGFETTAITLDFYGRGLDRHDMTLVLPRRASEAT